MKKYLVFIAFVLVLACGRYDKQYSKVISPNETLSTKVDCFTFAGLPLACIQIQNYEKTVEIVEIVERVVNQIVIETEYVEVETIVREVHAVYSEKDVDIGSIIVEVIGILTRDYPVIAAPVSSQRLSEIVTYVTKDVVENAPSVVINAETHTVTIEPPRTIPQNTAPIAQAPEVVGENPVIAEHQHTEACGLVTERVEGVAGNNGLADRRFAYVKAHNQVDGEVRSVQYGFWDEDGDHAIDPDEHEIWTVTYYNCESMR